MLHEADHFHLNNVKGSLIHVFRYQISPFSAFLIENPQILGKIKGKTPFSLKKNRLFTVIGREYVGRESTINLMRKGMGQQGHTTVKAT